MTDRPLDEDLRWCVEGFVARAPEWLGSGADSPDERQQRLHAAINAFRSEPAEVREARLHIEAYRVGCVWAQAVCDRLGWEWVVVSVEPEYDELGIVTPSRSHVVFPVVYARGLLGDPEREQTSLLLYNMLKAGSLPPAGPGEYAVLE
jgi:hypothetical protein